MFEAAATLADVVGCAVARSRVVVAVAVALMAASVCATAAPWRADEDNTRGWMLMTPQERIEHQGRVRGFTDDDECQAYRRRHHALMEQRAREHGLSLPNDHWDFCARLKHSTRPD